MKLDQLEEFLNKDLAWRKKEIADLILLLDGNQKSNVLQKSLILVLYAHWEGYVKKACKYYLKYVSESKVKLSELNQNFLALIVKKKALECLKTTNSSSLSIEFNLLQDIEKKKQQKFKLKIDPEKDMENKFINTESNLSSIIFDRLLKIIGLAYKKSIKSVSSNYIDKKLLAIRNSISHGSKVDEMSYAEVMKLKEIILLILDDFKEEVILYAEYEYFLAHKKSIIDELISKRDAHLSLVLKEIDRKHQV